MSHRKKQKAPSRPVNRPEPSLVTLERTARPRKVETAPAVATRPPWLNIAILIGVAAVLLGLGLSTMGEELPLSGVGAPNFLVVFFTGLTTGGLTCLAVQGGLLATTLAQRYGDERPGAQALAGRAMPIAAFLGAKLVSYTLLGGLLGWLGGALGLTPTVQGWLQIAAALFMLGVAGQILNLHPIFRYFSMQPPKWLQRRIRRESKSDSLFAPLVLGALTVFMPCATTQAMMVAALGTGSFVTGAVLLFAFTLGTTPLFFSLGYLATQLGAVFRTMFMRAAALAIIVLAVFSLTAGLALLGVNVPDLGILGSQAVAATLTNTQMQEIEVRALPTAYVPNRIVFKVGAPARLKLVTGDRLGCTSSFLIPALGYQKILWKNQQAVFTIPTDRPRQIPFTCSMGMYRGLIEVVA